MAVTLFFQDAKSAAGANVYADALVGGGSGVDFGQVTNGSYAPIIDKSANTGAQIAYINHDAVESPITEVKFYLANYTATGFTYGGSNTSSADLASVLAQGQASDESASAKNNNNGLAGGLWMDMQWDVSTTNQFDISTRSSNVKIFGNNGTDGIDGASAFDLSADAMLYSSDDTAEVAATTPVLGSIGKDNDTVLGDYAKLRFRVYLTSAFPDGGYFQIALQISYAHLA
jgi:hypothetical protein